MPKEMKQYIIPAIITVNMSITGWTASTQVESLRWLERLQANQDFTIASVATNSGNIEQNGSKIASNEQQLNEVPEIIARTLAIQSISGQLTELSTERNRLARIVNGFTQMPASPDDEMAYLDVLSAIDELCVEIETNLDSSHRACR